MPETRFIAETAFSHEGDASYMSEQVHQLMETEADIVKFQVLLEPEYMPDHPMASKCYGLMLSKSDWLELFNTVRSKGKKVLILPVDLEALKWVLSEQLADIIEVHSVNLFRKDFFEVIQAQATTEVILSVSGYELESIDFIVGQYKMIEGLELSLMLGFQSFPTDPRKLGLNRLALLRERYRIDVGYADHTAWDADSFGLCAAAIALGANTIEKHVVLSPGVERIDYNSAISATSLNELVFKLQVVTDALGKAGRYTLDETETGYGDRRLKLVSQREIGSGEVVSPPRAGYRWAVSNQRYDEVEAFEVFGSPSARPVHKGEIIA